MNWEQQRAKEEAIREARKDKGWIATDQPDPSTIDFRDKLAKIITDELIQRIEHIPEMLIQIGPYSHNFRNKANGNLIAIVTLNCSLEINWVHGPRLNEMGFSVNGVHDRFTLEGLISYINEEWLPRQKKKLKALRKRADVMKELEQAMDDMNARCYNYGNIPNLLKSIVVGYSTAKHWDTSEVYVISDEIGFRTLEKFRDYCWANYSDGQIWNPGWDNNKFRTDYKNLNLIIIVARRDKHQIRFQHFVYAPHSQRHRRSNFDWDESAWGSPKNLMKQLAKYSKQNPDVATILANPGVG